MVLYKLRTWKDTGEERQHRERQKHKGNPWLKQVKTTISCCYPTNHRTMQVIEITWGLYFVLFVTDGLAYVFSNHQIYPFLTESLCLFLCKALFLLKEGRSSKICWFTSQTQVPTVAEEGLGWLSKAATVFSPFKRVTGTPVGKASCAASCSAQSQDRISVTPVLAGVPKQPFNPLCHNSWHRIFFFHKSYTTYST